MAAVKTCAESSQQHKNNSSSFSTGLTTIFPEEKGSPSDRSTDSNNPRFTKLKIGFIVLNYLVSVFFQPNIIFFNRNNYNYGSRGSQSSFENSRNSSSAKTSPQAGGLSSWLTDSVSSLNARLHNSLDLANRFSSENSFFFAEALETPQDNAYDGTQEPDVSLGGAKLNVADNKEFKIVEGNSQPYYAQDPALAESAELQEQVRKLAADYNQAKQQANSAGLLDSLKYNADSLAHVFEEYDPKIHPSTNSALIDRLVNSDPSDPSIRRQLLIQNQQIQVKGPDGSTESTPIIALAGHAQTDQYVVLKQGVAYKYFHIKSAGASIVDHGLAGSPGNQTVKLIPNGGDCSLGNTY